MMDLPHTVSVDSEVSEYIHEEAYFDESVYRNVY